MRNIFTNKNSQLRSGWKITIVYLSFFFAMNILALIFGLVLMIYEMATNNMTAEQLMEWSNNLDKTLTNINTGLGFTLNLLQCLLLIFFTILFWKIFDKRPIRDIGMINIKKGYKDLIKGLLFGAISLLVVFAILLLSGNIALARPLTEPNFNISLITSLILFIFVGINEEMFVRGYCMTVLKQTGKSSVVVIVSSIIFSLMHSLNPGMNILSYINLFLFGLLTAYMTIKSKNIWLAIGYHITWNYFEGNICGFLVSGLETNSLFTLEKVTPNILNGGSFGPEGGLVVTFILLLSYLYMWKVYKPELEARD
ncbi:MAG: CPBP family intramembrane metalloprotease [Clostridiales bacterium]|nr:CPBP family intramembrane metalloprotease [Clostridiales bacterium]